MIISDKEYQELIELILDIKNRVYYNHCESYINEILDKIMKKLNESIKVK